MGLAESWSCFYPSRGHRLLGLFWRAWATSCGILSPPTCWTSRWSAFLTYELIVLVRQTRAAQLVKGILMLFVASFLSDLWAMRTLSYVLQKILQFGVLALVVVFQARDPPRLRAGGPHQHLCDLDL